MSKQSQFRTEARDFILYKKEVRRRIKELGLLEYRVSFQHKDDNLGDEEVPTRAYVYLRYPYATFGLSVDWQDDPVSDARIRYCAAHEVRHLLLNQLVALAKSRYATEKEIDDAEEATIHRLDYLEFGDTIG